MNVVQAFSALESDESNVFCRREMKVRACLVLRTHCAEQVKLRSLLACVLVPAGLAWLFAWTSTILRWPTEASFSDSAMQHSLLAEGIYEACLRSPPRLNFRLDNVTEGPACQRKILAQYCKRQAGLVSPLEATENLHDLDPVPAHLLEWLAPKAPENVSFAYLLFVHADAEQVLRLLAALYDPRDVFAVHIDAKTPRLFGDELRAGVRRMLDEREDARASDNIVFVPARRILWGGAGMLHATMAVLKQLTKSAHAWDFLINLSAADFPVATRGEMTQFLSGRLNLNFLSYTSEPPVYVELVECDNHLYNIGPPVELKSGTKSAFGSQWFVLSRPFCDWVAQSIFASALVSYLSNTAMPDERLVPMLSLNSVFGELTVQADNRHNLLPALGNGLERCNPERTDFFVGVSWCGFGPRTIERQHLAELLEQPAFFLRKFDSKVSAKALDDIQQLLAEEQPRWELQQISAAMAPFWSHVCARCAELSQETLDSAIQWRIRSLAKLTVRYAVPLPLETSAPTFKLRCEDARGSKARISAFATPHFHAVAEHLLIRTRVLSLTAQDQELEYVLPANTPHIVEQTWLAPLRSTAHTLELVRVNESQMEQDNEPVLQRLSIEILSGWIVSWANLDAIATPGLYELRTHATAVPAGEGGTARVSRLVGVQRFLVVADLAAWMAQGGDDSFDLATEVTLDLNRLHPA